MEYKFDLVHRDGVQQQGADELSRLQKNRTDDAYINDEIPVMIVAKRAQKRLNKAQDNTPDIAHFGTNEPQFPTVSEFMSVQSTDPYCDSIQPNVETSGLSINDDKNGLLVRQSPIDSSCKK